MSYSYVPVGTDGDAYDIMSQDVASKVYFAGEVSVIMSWNTVNLFISCP